MTPDDRKTWADQILGNPLFKEIFDKMESRAVDVCVNAALTDHETRAMSALQVRAIRSFRSDCEAALRNTQERKGAPA